MICPDCGEWIKGFTCDSCDWNKPKILLKKGKKNETSKKIWKRYILS